MTEDIKKERAHKEDGTIETWRIRKSIDDIEAQDILKLKAELRE